MGKNNLLVWQFIIAALIIVYHKTARGARKKFTKVVSDGENVGKC